MGNILDTDHFQRLEIETIKEVVTKNTYVIKPKLTLEELETIQTSLYETDRDGNLLSKIGDVVRDAQNEIHKKEQAEITLNNIERNVTQDEVLAAQGGACTTGNCD